MLEAPISTRDRLQSRPDVDDDDIPGIIARADAMQSEAKAKLEGRASVDEVIAVGRELDIEDKYVEAALDELRTEREPKPPTPRSPSSSRQWLPWLALGLGALGLVWLLASPSVDQQPGPEPLHVKAPDEPSAPVKGPPDVDEARPTVVPPPPPAHVPAPVAVSDLQEAIEGDWVLVSYHLQKDGNFFEVAVSEDKNYGARERWRLRSDGTFIHIMDGKLTFSGRYLVSVDPADKSQGLLPEGAPFVLTATDVHSNVPGIERPLEFFRGEIHNERLVLFYLGQSQDPKRPPSQAHGFRKSWKGGWTW
jgi:hypothetical protein